MAKSSGEEDIRIMWLNLANDYRYLLDLECFPSSPGSIAPVPNHGRSALAVQQPLVLGVDDSIAVAGGGLEALAVNNGNAAASVVDQPGLLQHSGGDGDGRPMHAEHLREKFMRERE
jgi:hypothetical protein